MNTEEEQREKMKMMGKQLGDVHDTAIELMKDKVLTDVEFTNFEHKIRAMQDCIDAAILRIECEHNNIEIVSLNDHYGHGMIDVTWKCEDCDTVMEGQIDMQELWRYGASSAVVQEGFEVKV